MQPPRAAGSLRIDGKEWKHMAWKFLAQDCSSDLSALVHFWHCPSSLQSLRDFMLSDQPDCLWLTFAMELLALTLTGVPVLVETIGIFTDSWKINFMGWTITLCSSLASNVCIDESFPSSTVTEELFVPLLSKARAACRGRTAAIIIHQPWTHIHWVCPVAWGTSRVKCVGTIYLFLYPSLKENWPDPSAAVLLRDVSPREIPRTAHISHYWEVHVILNANWMSI